MKKINFGTAMCLYEPRGLHGLEGYLYGSLYHFVEVLDNECKLYYRVYPSESDPYYETCSKSIFERYFAPTSRTKVVDHKFKKRRTLTKKDKVKMMEGEVSKHCHDAYVCYSFTYAGYIVVHDINELEAEILAGPWNDKREAEKAASEYNSI